MHTSVIARLCDPYVDMRMGVSGVAETADGGAMVAALALCGTSPTCSPAKRRRMALGRPVAALPPLAMLSKPVARLEFAAAPDPSAGEKKDPSKPKGSAWKGVDRRLNSISAAPQ
jgi:hypothetical protein